MIFLLLLLPFTASATTFTPVFGAGAEFGGDTLANVIYDDGSKSDIAAGRGLEANGGVVIDLVETTPHAFETQITVGSKWTSTKQAKNGSVDWIRWPIELLSFYRNTENHFRFGAGITYQFGNNLKGSKSATVLSTKFQNTTGLLLQGDYFVGANKNVGFGLRYTAISYSPVGSATSVNGDSFGFWFTYLLL